LQTELVFRSILARISILDLDTNINDYYSLLLLGWQNLIVFCEAFTVSRLDRSQPGDSNKL